MLEWTVVVDNDFVHILRPGNAGIVEGHLRLGPRRGRLVLGQRPRRPGTANGIRASTPTRLAAGPLLLLTRHQLEPVPGLLRHRLAAGRLLLLLPPHAFGIVHGESAALVQDVVEAHEQDARIREAVPPLPRDKRRAREKQARRAGELSRNQKPREAGRRAATRSRSRRRPRSAPTAGRGCWGLGFWGAPRGEALAAGSEIEVGELGKGT
uniref:Uncharacterized protein n=1 Tax=Arundo donax TaxID=35708 RepID=A0A0A9DF55_ARUDO